MSGNKEVKDKKVIASIIKAIEVIEYIANSEKELGVTEISNGLNYGVSATYHMLNTLKECNIIVQDSRTKKFKLGLKLWQIGMLAFEQNHISISLRPYLKKLRDYTGETANLTIMDNHKIVYIAQEESDRLVKMFTRTGATAPLHCTAAGKILLAYKPKEMQKQIIDRIELDEFTKYTITNKELLYNEIEKIVENGYGFDNEERELGVSCIGAPVFDLSGDAIACLTISGPSARFNKENTDKWKDMILKISKEASDHLKIIN